MDNHVTHWLHAYYDGELAGPRLKQVEAHLAECEQCRAELEALADLSDWLHSAPAPAPTTNAERFATQVELLLPREQEAPYWSTRLLRASWRAAPVVLATLWILVEVVLVVGPPVLAVLGLPVFGSPLACVSHVVNQPGIVELIRCSLGVVARQGIVLSVGLLVISWLAIWFANQARQHSLNGVK